MEINQIFQAVQDLYRECYRLYELVETETINGSVVRQRLHELPGFISKELTESVKAARDSNVDEISRLQGLLDAVNKDIDSLQDKHQQLLEENTKLGPDRKNVRDQHEEIIATLNHRLAEKAAKQIMLNETRDKVRDTNQQIVDLEEGMLQLKEDLIQERAQARSERKILKRNVYEISMKTREQKENNVVKKKETDELEEEVAENTARYQATRDDIRKYDIACRNLEIQLSSVQEQLDREMLKNDDLRLQGQSYDQAIKSEKTKAKDDETELHEQIDSITEAIEEEKKTNKQLKKRKDLLRTVTHERISTCKEFSSRVKLANDSLQTLKQTLAQRATEVGRLTQENQDMEEQITQLNETHSAITSTLGKQMEDLRDQLTRERKDRVALQEDRDFAQKKLDNFKSDYAQLMTNCSGQMSVSKERHEKLASVGTTLQTELRQNDAKLQQMQQQHTTRTAQIEQDIENKQQEIADLKVRLEEMHARHAECNTLHGQQLPGFLQLEEEYEQHTAEYEAKKKQLVAMKNKRLRMEEETKKAKRTLKDTKMPRKQLEQDLQEAREVTSSHLRTAGEQVSALEKDIYHVGLQLREAVLENSRLQQASDDLIADKSCIDTYTTNNGQFLGDASGNISDLKDTISEGWDKEFYMNGEINDRDSFFLEKFCNLLSRAIERESCINHIHSNLESEMKVLSDFMDGVTKYKQGAPTKEKTPLKRAKSKA